MVLGNFLVVLGGALGSWWLFVVHGGSLCFFVTVFGGSWWFLVVIGVYWCSCWFLVVLDGDWYFLVVLGCY